jgi:hypothetical protein
MVKPIGLLLIIVVVNPLKEIYKLMVFKSRVLKKIFEPTRNEITEDLKSCIIFTAYQLLFG